MIVCTDAERDSARQERESQLTSYIQNLKSSKLSPLHKFGLTKQECQILKAILELSNKCSIFPGYVKISIFGPQNISAITGFSLKQTKNQIKTLQRKGFLGVKNEKSGYSLALDVERFRSKKLSTEPVNNPVNKKQQKPQEAHHVV